jgi:hypothetical protein
MESNLPVKFVGTIDFQIQQSENSRGYNQRGGFKFNPAAIYMNQAGMDSWSVGLNIYKQPLYLGVWYRNSEFQFLSSAALILMFGLNANLGDNVRMKIMYSYDIMLTDLTSATGGSHELTLTFEMDQMRLFGDNRRNNFGHKRGFNRSTVECSPF